MKNLHLTFNAERKNHPLVTSLAWEIAVVKLQGITHLGDLTTWISAEIQVTPGYILYKLVVAGRSSEILYLI